MCLFLGEKVAFVSFMVTISSDLNSIAPFVIFSTALVIGRGKRIVNDFSVPSGLINVPDAPKISPSGIETVPSEIDGLFALLSLCL